MAINFKNNDSLLNICNMFFAYYDDKDWFLICNVLTDLTDWNNLSKANTSNADMVWQQNALLLLGDELSPACLHLVFNQDRVQSFDGGLFGLEKAYKVWVVFAEVLDVLCAVFELHEVQV